MQNVNARFEQRTKETLRIVLQWSVCIFLALGFASASSSLASPAFLSAANLNSTGASNPQQAQTRSATPSRTVSPTITTTRRSSSPPQAVRAPVAARSIPGQTQVDANTIALYHFDSPDGANAIDATGNYTGTLFGGATVTTSGLYAGVLQLDGSTGYGRTGHLGNLSSGTIEAFVDFRQACLLPDGTSTVSGQFAILSAVDEATGQTVLYLGAHTGLMFGIFSNGAWHWADSGINPCRYLNGPNPPAANMWPYETWRYHHVAATWGPRGIEIWVDGVLHGVGNNDPNAGTAPYPYMCNPQMQMGTGAYPRCATPAMAPLMTPYPPPGDYYGGLPSYSTFLIGKDSTGNFLKSSVDEVRISNTQRTFEWTVVPTLTPTPTWTPVYLTGEYPVDGYTLSLYHLNSAILYPYGGFLTVQDQAQGQYNGLSGTFNSISPQGRFNSSLWLGGDSFLDMGMPGTPGNGTVEAWVNLGNGSPHVPIMTLQQNTLSMGSVLYLGAPTGGLVGFGVSDGDSLYWVDSGVPISALAGTWHHIAGTWGARGVEIWIDGILRNVNTAYRGGLMASVYKYRAGCDPSGNCIQGYIDEIRFSTIQRLFTPNGAFLPTPTPTASSTPTASLTPTITPTAYWIGLPAVTR